jgi:ubiquinone/menaquinone biosynthesis C-methylase UbiE
VTVRAAYDRWARTYDGDRNLTRDLDARVLRRTLKGRRPKSVLEIGCGTGKNTAFLAKIARRVDALDFSEGMIRRARSKVASKSASFAVADLTQRWPCASAAFDLVVCDLVLEHVRDVDFAFREARRVLKRGGEFFLCEFHPFRQYLGKGAVIRRAKKESAIPFFVHHVSDFVSAADRAGFDLESVREWWHEEDDGKPPRLISFVFKK